MFRTTASLTLAVTALGLALAQAPAWAEEDQARPGQIQLAAKEHFERSKPHVNVGRSTSQELKTPMQRPDPTQRLQRTSKRPDKQGGLPRPDLAIEQILPAPNPVEGLPNQGYCYKWPVGGTPNRLVFRTRNNGTAAAPASTARVTFNGAGNVDVPTAALQPGEEWDQEVSIPNGCYPPGFHGSCNYTIRLDANNQVSESNEANNQDQSLCLQAAG